MAIGRKGQAVKNLKDINRIVAVMALITVIDFSTDTSFLRPIAASLQREWV